MPKMCYQSISIQKQNCPGILSVGSKIWLKTSAIILIMFFLGSCGTSKRQWEEARALDTTDAYNQFLSTQPPPDLANAAKRRLFELQFEKALATNSFEAYDQFLATQPPPDLAIKAQAQVASLTKKEIVVSVVPLEKWMHKIASQFCELLTAEGLTVCQQEKCNSAYDMRVEGKLRDASVLNFNPSLLDYKINKESAFSITYDVKSSEGSQILIDPKGIDYSKLGITRGPVPRDSRFFITVSVVQNDWSMTTELKNKLTESIRELLVPAIIAHHRKR